MANRSGGGGGDPNSPSARVAFAAETGAAGEEVGGKVKLLCSFGGRIAPRPGDGALRYVGGQMRLISLPRAASFGELMQKVAAAGAAGDGLPEEGVAVKYQLPGEDLDALISVSCQEDYENMMEEYEKLAAASPDGSAKLRVFLFSASGGDAAVFTSASHLAGRDDTGQRYVDAINCISADAASIRRKESMASAGSSTQNSEASECGGLVEGMSPPAISPAVIAPEYVYAGANYHPAAFPESLGFNSVAGSVPAMGIPAQNPTLVRAETPPQPPVASYAPPPQTYMDPQQVQYITASQLGMHVAPHNLNFVPVQMNQYIPSIPITNSMPVTTAQVTTLKPIPARTEAVLENPHLTRPVQPLGDQNYRVLQPLSQLPPLPPVHLHTSDAQKYGVPPALTNSVSVPMMMSSGTVVISSSTLPTVRYDDCPMCQKALPHAHSDNMIHEHGNVSPAGSPDGAPVFYSLHQDNVSKQHSPGAAAGAPPNYIAEQRVASTAAMGQFEPKLAGRKPVVQASSAPDVSALVQPTMVSLPASSAPVSNGVFMGNLPQSHVEATLRHQAQQQQQWQTMQPSCVPVNGFASNPQGCDGTTLRNVNYPVADPLKGYAHDISHDYVRAIDAWMQGIHLGPISPPESNLHGKPVVSPLGAIGDGKIEKAPMTMESASIYRSQAGGHPLGITNAFVTPALIPEENLASPMEKQDTSFHGGGHIVHPNISQQPSLLVNDLPVSNTLGMGVEPSVPNERFLVKPPYSGVPDSTRAPQLHPSEMQNRLVSNAPDGNSQFPLQNTAGVIDHVEAVQEPVYSGSLFSNQDPWNAVGNASLAPSRPTKLATREPVATKDPLEDHLPTSNGSTVAVLLEEGKLQQPQGRPGKEAHPGPIQDSKGSGEESVKRQLQAVAEGVAASVLQSSLSAKMAGIRENNVDPGRAVADPKIEDMRNNQLDKANQGGQVLEDNYDLQIIKNSDLEELRELGSGTFGTVYHGKWRGTDVAIKRINDRCFAGKASEQERMRTDFWNEARKLASLHHPNVVAFYGVVLDGPGGSVATVTEYMANGSLRQALQKNDKIFDRRKRLLIAMDVAFGMEYLHGKNIVHFDLKSDNLLVNLRDPQRPICKVGDLGLSKVKCQTLISGGVRGTLPWMAPELLNGSSSLVSEKVDVFSFGIVMWELLTGEEPYADLHYGAIIGGIVNNTLRPAVPESCDLQWRSLMEQSWSAEPSERPSFTEIVKRLRTMAASPTKGQTPK